MTRAITDEGHAYWFDKEAADTACDFFPEYLSHHKGEFEGLPFRLEPWQRELIIRPLFGWKRRDGVRRFRKVYIEVGKKNGKSKLAAGVALYLLYCDREPGADIVCAAADREQAALMFDDAKVMVEDSAELSSMSEVYRRSIIYAATRSSFKVVSADVRTKHGPNIHGLFIDELHAQPNRELTDTLSKGVAARKQPVTFFVTTAGSDQESVCREEHDYARHVMDGVIDDDTFLPVIFAADSADDWTVPATWTKANPSLGITVKRDYLEAECRAALAEPRKQNTFKRLHLNIWTAQDKIWIPIEAWDACQGQPDDPAGAVAVAAGMDLSSKLDLTAFVVVLKFTDARPAESITTQLPDASGPMRRTLNVDFRVAVFPFFWLPEAAIRVQAEADRVPYELWTREGLLRLTPGEVVDYDRVYADIVGEIGPAFHLTQGEIGFDPYNATQLALQLRDQAGYTVVEVPQTVRHLSEPAKLFEALVRSRRLVHNGHRLLRWNVSNVAVKEDKNSNLFPFKPSARKRIDGVSAILDGLSRLIVMPEANVYLSRGVRTLGT